LGIDLPGMGDFLPSRNEGSHFGRLYSSLSNGQVDEMFAQKLSVWKFKNYECVGIEHAQETQDRILEKGFSTPGGRVVITAFATK
jgi:hypothetical protein